MTGDGLSGNAIPAHLGEKTPYFRKAALLGLPSVLVAIAACYYAHQGTHNARTVCKVMAQLGAAYALGSNAWLFCYGPTMFKICTATSWLGKEAFSTIQASVFPDYFALQTAACIVALGGHFGDLWSPRSLVEGTPLNLAACAMLAALLFALLNLLVLGPKTSELMVQLYSGPTLPSNGSTPGEPLLSKEEAEKAIKRRFGMVHGISMLVNLANLGAVGAYIALTAAEK
eukprot:TRINITY_DN24779_c0_g1_i1.p1 TRINITY_DN24779_c0_g1~~TRINITY_DN24779_c0_g1_i1.p1  ORF type:complete len:229 (+),score=43.97 TRINITY_DN24779_c0_g1_i1:80-766(+)